MHCPACGVENRATAPFCRACGAALPRSCPSCGAGVPDDGAFCDACGRCEDARVAGEEAVAVAQRIAYPRLVWRGSSVPAEIARRQGRAADAATLVARRDVVVDALGATLPDGALAATLRRDSHEPDHP